MLFWPATSLEYCSHIPWNKECIQCLDSTTKYYYIKKNVYAMQTSLDQLGLLEDQEISFQCHRHLIFDIMITIRK